VSDGDILLVASLLILRSIFGGHMLFLCVRAFLSDGIPAGVVDSRLHCVVVGNIIVLGRPAAI